MNIKMTSGELREHIQEFLREHNEASLATTLNNTPRSSPVQYFTDQNMNIYILSAGGDKFKAIEQNPNVCLLVNTNYVGYRKIKGVQIFGKATTSLQDPHILDEARMNSNEPYVLNSESLSLNAIKIVPEEIVYLDSLKDGDRTKQVLRDTEVIVKSDMLGTRT